MTDSTNKPLPTLSILIPIYNYDIRALAQGLHAQGQALGLPFELLCYDDASAPEWQAVNAPLGDLPHLRYRALPSNLGRSRIRNLLAEEAQYDYLLFLDCDSALPDEHYLARYAEELSAERLLYGGRSYQPQAPSDKRLLLHWHYGRCREVQPAERRQRQPYHSFMTNNFLIPKALFQPIRFDERLLQYGHEDTLFGQALQQRGIPIRHLDNPLLHTGLETAEVFLAKSRQALANLAFLHQSGSGIDTRLLRAYTRMAAWPGSGVLFSLLQKLRPALERQLRTARPSLRLFDGYKLACLAAEMEGLG